VSPEQFEQQQPEKSSTSESARRKKLEAQVEELKAKVEELSRPAPEPERLTEPEPVVGLEIFSWLVYDVDCGLLTMPQARHALGEWWHKQDRSKVTEPGRARMRRLKQITDALYEEFWSLAGSQS
jgi:hypothetical protein